MRDAVDLQLVGLGSVPFRPLPEPVAATSAAVSVMLAAVAAGRLVDVAVPVELGYTVLNS